jgi:tetratricopeptide (TPR) repeat protein
MKVNLKWLIKVLIPRLLSSLALIVLCSAAAQFGMALESNDLKTYFDLAKDAESRGEVQRSEKFYDLALKAAPLKDQSDRTLYASIWLSYYHLQQGRSNQEAEKFINRNVGAISAFPDVRAQVVSELRKEAADLVTAGRTFIAMEAVNKGRALDMRNRARSKFEQANDRYRAIISVLKLCNRSEDTTQYWLSIAKNKRAIKDYKSALGILQILLDAGETTDSVIQEAILTARQSGDNGLTKRLEKFRKSGSQSHPDKHSEFNHLLKNKDNK